MSQILFHCTSRIRFKKYSTQTLQIPDDWLSAGTNDEHIILFGPKLFRGPFYCIYFVSTTHNTESTLCSCRSILGNQRWIYYNQHHGTKKHDMSVLLLYDKK